MSSTGRGLVHINEKIFSQQVLNRLGAKIFFWVRQLTRCRLGSGQGKQRSQVLLIAALQKPVTFHKSLNKKLSANACKWTAGARDTLFLPKQILKVPKESSWPCMRGISALCCQPCARGWQGPCSCTNIWAEQRGILPARLLPLTLLKARFELAPLKTSSNNPTVWVYQLSGI